MKLAILAASAVVLFGVGSAMAQGPTYSNTIHQSAGDRDSRGTPKYYQSQRSYSYRHARPSRSVRGYSRSTTGAGASGPYYERSIHQSAGDRDARGTPKYNQEK